MSTLEIDYYALLSIELDSTLQQIKSAYRKQSLKVHPDRNPDNPEAATLFHNLKQAFDILSDPIQRATFDALNLARQARAERFKGLDNKRKALAEELIHRENEFKRAKGEGDMKAREERNQLERLREDGKKRREEADRVAQSVSDRDQVASRKERERKERERHDSSGVIELGPLDTTLKIKWLKSAHPQLLAATDWLTFISTHLLSPEMDSLVLSPKFLANPTKGKHGSGVISFKTLRAAVRLMEAVSAGGNHWQGIEVNWASGSIPAVLVSQQPPVVNTASSFPSSMLVDSDESRILESLRMKERAKMIAEMERAEAAES